MKNALFIILALAALALAFAAGRLDGIRHATTCADAWIEPDGYVVIEVDGTEYRIAAF